MLETMLSRAAYRVCLLALAASVVLAGCSLPPLHRSTVVQTNASGVPIHASGHMARDHYTVARGDTLYSIAFRANVDYHQLARWNSIRAPYIIYPGQVLRLSAPPHATAPAANVPVFHTVSSAAASSGHEVSSAAGEAAEAAASAASSAVAVAGNQPPVATPTQSNDASIPDDATRRAAGITWRWPVPGKVLTDFSARSSMPGIVLAGKRGEPVRAAASGVVVYAGDGLPGYGELVIVKHSDDYLSAYGHNSKRLVKEGEHVRAGQIIARMGSTGAPRNELEFQVRYKGKPVDPLHYLPKR